MKRLYNYLQTVQLGVVVDDMVNGTLNSVTHAATGMTGVASAAKQTSKLYLGRSWNSLLKFTKCPGKSWTASGATEDWTTQ